MIDTPASIMANRNTTSTNGHVYILTAPLIIGVEKSNSGVLPTMTAQTAILLGHDNIHYRNISEFYGAVETNPDWIGNVSED